MDFPVIALPQNDAIEVCDQLPRSCSYLALQKEYFTSLSYFDSTGRLWPVSSIVLEKQPSFLGKLFNFEIPISIEIGEPINNSLDVAKKIICTLIDKDPDDLYDQFVSHEELKGLVKEAHSPTELIQAIGSLGAK